MLTGRLDMGDYQGKVVVVTGGGSGLGAAMADLFAIQGAKIALLDIDFERAEAKAVMLRQGGTERGTFASLAPALAKGLLQGLFQNPANGAIVIDNPDFIRLLHGWFPLVSRARSGYCPARYGTR